mgnify:CR=1 FL=1
MKLNHSKLIDYICSQLSEQQLFSKANVSLSESDLNGVSDLIESLESGEFENFNQSNFIDLDRYDDEILGVAARLKARKPRFVYSTGGCNLISDSRLVKVDDSVAKLIVEVSVFVEGHLTYVHEDWNWHELTGGRFDSTEQAVRYLSQIFNCRIEDIPTHLNFTGVDLGFMQDMVDLDRGIPSEEEVFEFVETHLNTAKLNQFFITRTLGFEDLTDRSLDYSKKFEVLIDLKDFVE